MAVLTVLASAGFSNILFRLSSGMSNLSILFPGCRSSPRAASPSDDVSTCQPGGLQESEPEVADAAVATCSPFPDWTSIVVEKPNLPSNHPLFPSELEPRGEIYCVSRTREEVMRVRCRRWLGDSLGCGQKEEGKKFTKTAIFFSFPEL